MHLQFPVDNDIINSHSPIVQQDIRLPQFPVPKVDAGHPPVLIGVPPEVVVLPGQPHPDVRVHDGGGLVHVQVDQGQADGHGHVGVGAGERGIGWFENVVVLELNLDSESF